MNLTARMLRLKTGNSFSEKIIINSLMKNTAQGNEMLFALKIIFC